MAAITAALAFLFAFAVFAQPLEAHIDYATVSRSSR